MLSLKATLKAIGESITTIKSALDGKATKYTGYGTSSLLTTSWTTLPSDGFIKAEVNYYGNIYVYVSVRNNGSTGSGTEFQLASASNGSVGSNNNIIPVFKGQQAKISNQNDTSRTSARYYPFI